MEQELVNAVLAMDDDIKAKKFVVFIDTQVDFMVEGSALYVAGAEPVISKLNAFAYHLKPEEVEGVLFTFDTHYDETYPTSEEAKQFPIHCVYNTPGWRNVINPEIINRDIPKYALRKGVFNMWEDVVEIQQEAIFPHASEPMDRDVFFNDLKAAGITDIVIVGVAADFCVKWAADGFIDRGFNVTVPRSLTAGILRDIDTVVAEDYAGKNFKVAE